VLPPPAAYLCSPHLAALCRCAGRAGRPHLRGCLRKLLPQPVQRQVPSFNPESWGHRAAAPCSGAHGAVLPACNLHAACCPAASCMLRMASLCTRPLPDRPLLHRCTCLLACLQARGSASWAFASATKVSLGWSVGLAWCSVVCSDPRLLPAPQQLSVTLLLCWP